MKTDRGPMLLTKEKLNLIALGKRSLAARNNLGKGQMCKMHERTKIKLPGALLDRT